MFSRFRQRVYRSHLLDQDPSKRSASQCQELQIGWDQDALRQSSVWLIGGGGLGSEIAPGLVQSGVGHLDIIEPDVVEASNLHRQRFRPRDIGRSKAAALARNVTLFGALGTSVRAHDAYFESFLEQGNSPPSLVVAGVDNDQARLAAARFCLKNEVPFVNVGHSQDGTGLQVFVQEQGRACFRCFMGEVAPGRAPCGGLPVDKTLCQMAGALTTRAIFSVLMPERPRTWQALTFFPDTGVSFARPFERRLDCSLCMARDA